MPSPSYCENWRLGRLNTLVSDHVTNAVVEFVCRLRCISRSKRSEDEEKRDDDSSEDHEFAQNRTSLSELSPNHGALCKVFLHLLTAQLVVNEATQGDAVTESLQQANGVTEQDDRCKDEENVLEHARQGKDEGRSLADLVTVSV